jgi:hypothetical protein
MSPKQVPDMEFPCRVSAGLYCFCIMTGRDWIYDDTHLLFAALAAFNGYGHML